jgi:hypothetical protein
MTPQDTLHNPDIQKAAQNARTRNDHNALSKYFESAATELKNKAQEQKKLLEHYEEKGYLYGRQAQDLKSHTAALVRKYEESAEENVREAALHRRKAAELVKNDVALRGSKADEAVSNKESD